MTKTIIQTIFLCLLLTCMTLSCTSKRRIKTKDFVGGWNLEYIEKNNNFIWIKPYYFWGVSFMPDDNEFCCIVREGNLMIDKCEYILEYTEGNNLICFSSCDSIFEGSFLIDSISNDILILQSKTTKIILSKGSKYRMALIPIGFNSFDKKSSVMPLNMEVINKREE